VRCDFNSLQTLTFENVRQRSRARAAVRGWCQFARECVRVRRNMARAVERMACTHVRYAVRGWCEFARQCVRVRRDVVRAVDRMARTRSCAAVRGWFEFARECVQVRRDVVHAVVRRRWREGWGAVRNVWCVWTHGLARTGRVLEFSRRVLQGVSMDWPLCIWASFPLRESFWSE